MKKYKILLPVAMVLLMALAWYSLFSDVSAANSEYNAAVESAREYAQMGAMKYAMDYYGKALDLKSSPDLYREIIDAYRTNAQPKQSLSWSETFTEVYPANVTAYEYLLREYAEQKDYEGCFDVITTARKRGLQSSALDEQAGSIAYVYDFDLTSYEDVGIYSNNFCPVMNDGRWGYVDRFGKNRVRFRLRYAGPFSSTTSLTSVIDTDGNLFLMDKSGARAYSAENEYVLYGLQSDGLMPAQKPDGTWDYLDYTLNKVLGSYEAVSAFNSSTALVKTNGAWNIIDTSGTVIGPDSYEDVIVDEKGIANRGGCIFAKKDGSWILVDYTGKRIGSLVFDDARLFASGDYAAVRIGTEWCFIDKNGERISDQTYEDARSFSNGLAAVKQNGKWGFADEEENIVIDCQFSDAKDFNEKGSCFVKTGDSWRLLKLYRLNREE